MVAPAKNYHLHEYKDLTSEVVVTGYVIAVHRPGQFADSMIGPIASLNEGELLIALLHDLEEREFHLWPMAAPKELLKNGQ
jgi:hypothetical protein